MQENLQMQDHKNKYKDILMQIYMLIQEEIYLLVFQVNMINKLSEILLIIHMQMVFLLKLFRNHIM